jgi:4-hydroxybenzoate polyprenyltransferase
VTVVELILLAVCVFGIFVVGYAANRAVDRHREEDRP